MGTTFALIGSPSAAQLRRESTDPQIGAMRTQALADWKAGRVTKAAAIYRQAYHRAISIGAIGVAAVLRSNIAGIDFAMFHYQDALEGFLEARSLAEKQSITDTLGLIASNLASLYLEL